MTYFPTHAHSEFSWLDAMGTVPEMVQKTARLEQPALALTDHGVMAGNIALYQGCRKVGILPYPGEEFYLVRDVEDKELREQRYHLGLLALNNEGYTALIALSTRSHLRERYHRKPLIDLSDLASMYEAGVTDGIALTTGCFFGLFQQTLVHQGEDAALQVAKRFAGWFPNTYVEVQHHNIVDSTHDDNAIVEASFRIADKAGLPVVIGQDSHYCNKPHKQHHDFMKTICYFGDSDDFTFPGDSFHLATTDWVKRHYTSDQWDRAMEGHQDLLDRHDLLLPDLDTYQMRVPSIAPLPDRKLSGMVATGMAELGGLDVDSYMKRVDTELDVIKQMGFADYFLLTANLCRWMRDADITFNVRGSANGSLICYYLHITQVNPIEWRTDFDRFLALDRQKPPDIDIDVESTRRQDVIDYLKTQFPTMVQIGTYSKLGLVTDVDADTGETKDRGSLMVQYQSASRKRLGHAVAPENIPASDLDSMDFLSDVACRKSPGTHAGGFVLPGKDHPIEKHLATMLIASSNTTVTQATMDDVESAGYVKLDILGLRSLATVNTTLTSIGMELTDIPLDDGPTLTMIRRGHTAGLFQLEGFTTRKGAREMGVRSTADVIACMALYRPAAAIQRRKYLEHREAGTKGSLCSSVDGFMRDTYGVPIFQEQALAIMKAGGLAFNEYNEIIKAVKASNDKIAGAILVFDRIKPIYISRAVADQGFTPKEAANCWATIAEFTDYGFNRAHATAYGLMAYRSAWLKKHHPLEYMAALLDVWAGTPKETGYLSELRRLKISVVKPDVNHSDVSWTIDTARSKPALRKGLLSIPSIGLATADVIVTERTQNGPYLSMEEFISRVPARPITGGKDYKKSGLSGLKGVMRTLAQADALRSVEIRNHQLEE